MRNGEAVFEAPWQGRVFGMAHALADSGVFTWDEFRAQLIAEIADWDRTGAGEYAYFEHFQRALERVLAGRDVVQAAALSERPAALDQRPHGHDQVRHDHHGEHGHPHHDH